MLRSCNFAVGLGGLGGLLRSQMALYPSHHHNGSEYCAAACQWLAEVQSRGRRGHGSGAAPPLQQHHGHHGHHGHHSTSSSPTLGCKSAKAPLERPSFRLQTWRRFGVEGTTGNLRVAASHQHQPIAAWRRLPLASAIPLPDITHSISQPKYGELIFLSIPTNPSPR